MEKEEWNKRININAVKQPETRVFYQFLSSQI